MRKRIRPQVRKRSSISTKSWPARGKGTGWAATNIRVAAGELPSAAINVLRETGDPAILLPSPECAEQPCCPRDYYRRFWRRQRARVELVRLDASVDCT